MPQHGRELSACIYHFAILTNTRDTIIFFIKLQMNQNFPQSIINLPPCMQSPSVHLKYDHSIGIEALSFTYCSILILLAPDVQFVSNLHALSLSFAYKNLRAVTIALEYRPFRQTSDLITYHPPISADLCFGFALIRLHCRFQTSMLSERPSSNSTRIFPIELPSGPRRQSFKTVYSTYLKPC